MPFCDRLCFSADPNLILRKTVIKGGRGEGRRERKGERVGEREKGRKGRREGSQ